MTRKNIFIFMILALVSCTKTQVKDSPIETPQINQPAIATVLSTNVTDNTLAECVQRELEIDIPNLKFIPEDKFRDALFPWFEPNTSPQSIEDLGSLMNHPLVQDRIQSIGVHFIIFVGGYQFKGEFGGPFMVVGGFGAAGAFGYISADRKTQITAVIWDFKKKVSLGEVKTEKSGSFKWIGLILPIPIPDASESAACRETAARIWNCLK